MTHGVALRCSLEHREEQDGEDLLPKAAVAVMQVDLVDKEVPLYFKEWVAVAV